MNKKIITQMKAYVAPTIEVICLNSEGVLATSGISTEGPNTPPPIKFDASGKTIGKDEEIFSRRLEQTSSDIWDE